MRVVPVTRLRRGSRHSACRAEGWWTRAARVGTQCAAGCDCTIDVQAVICNEDRTQASLFGNATVDGSGSYEYQIDLQDNGEPGTNDKYRIFIPGVAYESGLQTLRGGNVQIR